MSWFRKKQEAAAIAFGTLRIRKTWSGRYEIQEYKAKFFGSPRVVLGWWVIEDAGEFDTAEAAMERIRFMGKFNMLMTGQAA
jgi:hypothetical protein